MALPAGAVGENHTFFFRRVTRVIDYWNTSTNATAARGTLPSPCWRWTGSGDRPCDEPYTPLSYAIAPWQYAHVRLDAMALYWSWSRADPFNPYVYTESVAQPYQFPDYSLVEVGRYAERTSYVGSDGSGYGIWFWTMPGSGVSVNIGRALRFDNKHDAIRWSRSVALGITLNCTTTSMASCLEHDDLLLCPAAKAAGFDSVLVRRYRIKLGHVSGLLSDMVELILCPAEEPPEQRTACPSMLTFQTASGGPCTCSQEAELLTCVESGDDGRLQLAHDYGTRPALLLAVFALVYLMLPLFIFYSGRWAFRGRWRRASYVVVSKPEANNLVDLSRLPR